MSRVVTLMVRAFRIGLWTLAIVAVLGLIQHAVSDVVIVMFRTSGTHDIDEWQRFFHTNSIVGWVHDAVIVAAAITCAVASDGLRRTWFRLLAAGTAASVLLILAPWLASFVKEPSFAITMWSWRASAAASAFAAVSFAIAAQQSSTNKRLTDALMIATAGRFLLYIVFELMRDQPYDRSPEALVLVEHALGGIASVLWVFVALDLLGAFPSANVTLRTPARSLAGAAAVFVCVLGIAYAAFAVWLTQRIATTDEANGPLTFGTVLFASGAFALACMRGRRPPLAAAIPLTLVVIAIGRYALGFSATPVEKVELEVVRLPGIAMSVPRGSQERAIYLRERGELTVMTRHADLGLVRVTWQTRGADPIDPLDAHTSDQITTESFTEQLHDLAFHGVVWAGTNVVQLHASWQCPGDARWFVLELSRYSPEVEVLRSVTHRIFETIECAPGTIDDAPALAAEVTPPPSFARIGPDDFRTPQGEHLQFLWSANDDYVSTLRGDPAALLKLVGLEAFGETAVDRAPMVIVQRDNDVETEKRQLLEVDVGDRRTLVTAWHCYSLDVDFVAFYTGPIQGDVDAQTAILRGARCPR